MVALVRAAGLAKVRSGGAFSEHIGSNGTVFSIPV
jgi:hypothetical protein